MKEKINYRSTSIACKITLWVGISTILLSLGYLILNLANADSFIATWIFFMIIGISFSFIGGILGEMIIKASQKKASSFNN